MENQPQTPISNRGFDAQFLSIVPRYNPLVLSRFIASVDNVRIKYVYQKSAYDFEKHARFDVLDGLCRKLTSIELWNRGDFDIDVGHDSFFGLGRYLRTITYKLADGNSFALLVGRFCTDNSVKQLAPEIILDFNPNKIPEHIWRQVARILSPMAIEIAVQRFDLAIDIPMHRDQLELIRRSGSAYQKNISSDGKAVTEYTGERSKHAEIKLYDKGEEIGVPDLVCTRCEITIDPKKYNGIVGLFPEIISLVSAHMDVAFHDLPFPVQAVILHPDLHDLLKDSCCGNTWRKYRKMIEAYGTTYYTLTDDECSAVDFYLFHTLDSLASVGASA